jgi:hypothetical protein
LKPEADALFAKLTVVEETVYWVKNRSDQEPLNFRIRLNDNIAALARSLMSGDSAPTRWSRTTLRSLTGR